MEVGKFTDGLWWWHTDGHRSVYAETDGWIVLVDPVLPSDAGERLRFWRALDRDLARLGRPVAVLRSSSAVGDAAAILEHLADARVFEPGTAPEGIRAVPTGERWAYLVEPYGALVGTGDLSGARDDLGEAVVRVVVTGDGSPSAGTTG